MVKHISFLAVSTLIGSILLYAYSYASLHGLLERWETLGSPPSKAIKVVDIGFVQTASGNIYQQVYNVNCKDNCWALADFVTPAPSLLFSSTSCGRLPSLSKYVDSKVACQPWGPGKSLSIYAIDENGTVYAWEHKVGEGDSLIYLLSPFLGAVVGLIFGISILIAVWLLNLFKPQGKEDNSVPSIAKE
jgi:hypothetical protein